MCVIESGMKPKRWCSPVHAWSLRKSGWIGTPTILKPGLRNACAAVAAAVVAAGVGVGGVGVGGSGGGGVGGSGRD